MNNLVNINNQNVTLVVPDDKKKLVRGIEALRATITYDNEKDKQIYTIVLKSYEKAIRDIKNSLLVGEYYV